MQKQSAESIARALGGARRSGLDWSCRCPAHQDNKASLSIVDKNGKLLVHCHAGCAQSDVISKLKQSGLWYGSEERSAPKVEIDLPSAKTAEKLEKVKSKIVAEYPYVDENGVLLFTAIRYEPKDFRQRAPDGSWSIKGIRRVLYRLPKIVEAVKKGDTIYLVEGEKDVHAAESIGLVATCNPMGADNGSGNKFLAEFSEVLRGANVVVVPDQDESGKRHAEWVISTLISSARSLKVCNPKVGKDLADWIAAGAKAQDVVEGSQLVGQPATTPQKESRFTRLVGGRELLTPIQWVIEDCIEDNALAEIFGPSTSGKSFVAISMAHAIATGIDWFGHSVTRGAVFYLAGEGQSGLRQRFLAQAEDTGNPLDAGYIFLSDCAVSLFNEESAKKVTDDVKLLSEKNGVVPKLVVIDTLARSFGDGNENETKDMNVFIDNLDKYIRIPFGCTVLVIHHSGHVQGRARGSSVLKAAVEAEFEVAREESTGVIMLKNHKQKNAEAMSDKMFRLVSHDFGIIAGKPVKTAVLKPADEADLLSKTYGKFKVPLNTILESFAVSALSINQAKQSTGLAHETTKEAIEECVRNGFLVADSSKKYSLTEKGKNLLSIRGNSLRVQDKFV